MTISKAILAAVLFFSTAICSARMVDILAIKKSGTNYYQIEVSIDDRESVNIERTITLYAKSALFNHLKKLNNNLCNIQLTQFSLLSVQHKNSKKVFRFGSYLNTTPKC